MKKISNSEELNQYYGKINKYIDDYIKSYKVSPNEIYRYINKNMKRFLEKFKIDDIENINIIVKDVIEHRRNMEKDKVFKFEQFSTNLNESLIYLAPSTIEHEKILADLYNTSLGHVDVLDSNLHLYEIKDFDTPIRSIIFSSNEVNELKVKVKEQILLDLCEISVSLDTLDGNLLNKPFSFLLGAILSKELVKSNLESKLNEQILIDVITNSIPNSVLDFQMNSIRFREIFKGFYIWEV